MSFAAMGWGAPLANQEFRTTLAGSVQPKGSAELTLGELRSRRSHLSAMLRESLSPQLAYIYFERTDLRYHRRYALPSASLVVVLLLLARSRTTNRLLLASQGAIACALYFVLLVAGDVATRDGWLSGGVAAWLPNVLFVLAATALSLRSRIVANGVQEV